MNMLQICLATLNDATAISQLVYSLSAKYIASDLAETGARNLLSSMEPSAIASYLSSEYRYHVAEDEGSIVGVVATRDNKHLYHLFVAESHQRRGLARVLWCVAWEACVVAGNPGEFTVNSSQYALPFYEKLGFIQVGLEENHEGVVYTPMKLDRSKPNTSLKRTPQSGATELLSLGLI
jgi:ribosomal protein S18 acetylase RimI-like enzyme